MRQYCERKIQEEDGFWVSLLIEIILKEKLGMQNTFSKTKVGDTWTVPTCVTLAISPLGNLIEIWTVEVMEVKNWVEWTMWSVAPLSRIQSMEVMWVVTTFEQKTEYSKGVDQIPKNSFPWRPMEDWVMMLATWWVFEATSGGA